MSESEAAPPVDEGMLEKVLGKVLRFDPVELRAEVTKLRAASAGSDDDALARQIYSRTAWKGAVSGALSGVSANPFAALPAAVADFLFVLRVEARAAALVATVYDPEFFDGEDAGWELLIPMLGHEIAAEALGTAPAALARQLTRRMLRKHLSKNSLARLQKTVLKLFGVRIGQKAIAAKALPLIGIVVGAGWNYAEIKRQGSRVRRYFAADRARERS